MTSVSGYYVWSWSIDSCKGVLYLYFKRNGGLLLTHHVFSEQNIITFFGWNIDIVICDICNVFSTFPFFQRCNQSVANLFTIHNQWASFWTLSLLEKNRFFQEKVCFSDQSSHRDTWSHSKMTLLAWIICTLGGLGVSVDQREDCLDHLGNHLRPYTTIRLHRHNIFKRGLIAVFKDLFRIFSSFDLQSPWVIPREPTTSNSPGNWFTPSKVDNHFIFICWKLSLIYPFV